MTQTNKDVRIMVNPKTNRFVFNYKYEGKNIPNYIIFTVRKSTSLDDLNTVTTSYWEDIIPVRKQKIASITTKSSKNKYNAFDSNSYYGYSLYKMHKLTPNNLNIYGKASKEKNTLVNYYK